MRDYGRVSPNFWVGETGKRLRGDAQTQVVAMYLMTSPHSTMTGVFHCPLLYIAHETGSPMEGASKSLARLIGEAFCEYDEASEMIFVLRMAAFQIAEHLDATDKRVVWLRKEVEKITSPLLKQRFIEVYGRAFHLNLAKPHGRGTEAPSKPGSGTGAESGAEGDARGKPPRAARSPATRLPVDFELTPERRALAIAEHLDPERTFAKFTNYWKAASGAKARKHDWQATWANWCITERDRNGSNGNGAASPGDASKWL